MMCMSVKKLAATMVAVVVMAAGAWAQTPETYVLSGMGGSSVATKGGATLATGAIADVINAIKNDAALYPCTIQFDNYGASGSVTFDGGPYGTDWGKITLTGSVTGSGGVSLTNGASAESSADISGGIRNNSTGTLTITGGTIGGGVANSNAGIINITAGTVSGNVTNSFEGIINIAGGTVSGGVTNSGSGAINVTEVAISGRVYNSGSNGKITITGGTISNQGGDAVSNNSSWYGGGKVTINGASITGNVINDNGYSYSADTITIANANITGNINNTAIGGYITLSGTTMGGVISNSGTMTLSGTTVSSNNSSTTGGVISNSGTMTVIGGKILNTSASNDANAIYCSATSGGSLVLGGDVEIAGGAISTRAGWLRAVADGDSAFAPGGRLHVLKFASPSDGAAVVTDGGEHLSNFMLSDARAGYRLEASGGDIVLSAATETPSIVRFNINGGTGTAPAIMYVWPGSKLPKINFGSITKTGYIPDGKWYTDAAGTTEFVFGENGTAVTGDITLYVKWIPTSVVSFNLNGGTGTAPAAITAPTDSALGEGQKPSTAGFTKLYHVSDGKWYTDAEGTTEFVFGANGTAVPGDITLYLKWVRSLYVVSFNLNGGTGAAPAAVTAPIDGTLEEGQKPATEGFTKLCSDNDGEWYIGSDFDVTGPRNVTIAMRDNASDGWDGGGALRISVNGVNLPNNVRLSSGNSGTYTFDVNGGDVVNFYWVAGSAQGENAFAVYYTDNPPSPAFNPASGASNDAAAILLSRQYSSMGSVAGGTLLGSFTVQGGATPATYTKFEFGANGTAVTGDITLYLKWALAEWYEELAVSGDTVTISSAKQLAYMAALVNSGSAAYTGKHIFLDSDIDLSAYGEGSEFNNGKGWIPIGTASNRFGGFFNGNGHKITGLYINDAALDYAGLFGRIGTGVTGSSYQISSGTHGTVERLALVDVNVTAKNYVGGVAGFIGGWSNTSNVEFVSIVKHCYVTGSVSGGDRVGGIVGSSDAYAGVGACWSTAEVTGGNRVGGIAGDSDGGVENCAALNTRVSGTGTYVGRVAGHRITRGDDGINYAITWPVLVNNVAFNGILTRAGTTSWLHAGADSIDGLTMTKAAINIDGTLGGGNGWFTADTIWTTQDGFLPGFGAPVAMPEHLYMEIASAETPVITSLTENTSVEVGGEVELSVAATASVGTLSYKWYKNTVASNSGGVAVGGVRNLTILMRDNASDGWDGSGALRISVNGVNLPNNVKLSSGNSGTYTFDVNGGDVVDFYWVAGSAQNENAFAVYYTDNPPSTAFNPASGASNDAAAILLSRQYSSMGSVAGGTLLGSLTIGGVDGTKESLTVEESEAGEYYYYVVVTNTAPGDVRPTRVTSDVIAVTVGGQNSVKGQDRVVPTVRPKEEASVVAPVSQLSGEFTAGPNPVGKQSGEVKFFRQGKRVGNGELRIYDATGNVINKVKISDKALGSQAKRVVGSWNLTDSKGRQVSEGTYLVKGVIKTSDGKSEKVSVIVGVR